MEQQEISKLDTHEVGSKAFPPFVNITPKQLYQFTYLADRLMLHLKISYPMWKILTVVIFHWEQYHEGIKIGDIKARVVGVSNDYRSTQDKLVILQRKELVEVIGTNKYEARLYAPTVKALDMIAEIMKYV